MSDLGKVAYDAYSQSVGGVSKFTGEKLPAYADQSEEIRAAWQHAALIVRQEVIEGERGLAGQFLAGWLDKLAEHLRTVEGLVVDHRAECERAAAAAIDYPKHWGREAMEAERRHRERMASISTQAEFRRGVEVGRAQAEAEQIDGELVCEVGPTDYEVWRDAWHLAVLRLGNAADLAELGETAEWFHARLEHAAQQDVYPDAAAPSLDCLHCGADSSMDHNHDCPNGERLTNPDPAHYRDDAEGQAAYAQAARLYRDQEEATARTFPGVNPDGTGTGEFSGRAGG